MCKGVQEVRSEINAMGEPGQQKNQYIGLVCPLHLCCYIPKQQNITYSSDQVFRLEPSTCNKLHPVDVTNTSAMLLGYTLSIHCVYTCQAPTHIVLNRPRGLGSGGIRNGGELGRRPSADVLLQGVYVGNPRVLKQLCHVWP